MRKVFLLAAVATVGALLTGGVAHADPYTLQRYDAKINGNNKAGTSKKPRAISVTLNPHHDVGLAGGPTNAGKANTGAVLENPFATVFAYTWFPKEIKVQGGTFPGCSEKVILDTPDKCPKGSEIGTTNPGGRNPQTGKDNCEEGGVNDKGQPVNCKVYATGLVRNFNAVGADGTYVLPTVLAVRIFNMTSDQTGKKLKDTIALRVISPVSGNVIIRGEYGKVSSQEKSSFNGAKSYSSRVKFIIPSGLIAPTDTLIAQLTDFNAGIKALTSKGKPYFGLAGCPKSKKLKFGYNGQYNIGLDKNAEPRNAPANGGYSINATGPVISTTVACKR